MESINDKTIEGTIHTTANRLNIDFENGKYYIEDCYGNNFYLCKYNKRQFLFEFYRRNDVQFMSYEEFILEFCKVSKRKSPLFYNS